MQVRTGKLILTVNNQKITFYCIIFAFFEKLILEDIYIQGYPQRTRIQRRLYGIYYVCYLTFMMQLNICLFSAKSLDKPLKDLNSGQNNKFNLSKVITPNI